MEEPKHDNLVIYDPEVYGIWKPPQQATPECAMDHRVKRWIL
jgi:hypothetical protein